MTKHESSQLDEQTPRKRKTRHSDNPPVECHVGWVVDSKEHRVRTSSSSSVGLGTSPSESNLATASGSLSSSVGSAPQSLPSFQHPSHALLRDNNFTQQVYTRYRARCLKGAPRVLSWNITHLEDRTILNGVTLVGLQRGSASGWASRPR